MGVASKQTFPQSQKDNLNVFNLYYNEVSTNATPTVFDSYSIPADTAAMIKVDFVARTTGVDQTTTFSGSKIWNVSRGTGNAVLLNTADGDGFESENYAGAPPLLRVLVNTTNLDFQLVGKAATSMNWQISYQIIENKNNG